MEKVITFYGPDKPYFELANFFERSIWLDEKEWCTIEHYFQAQKTRVPKWQEKIRVAQSPAEAKKIGWEVPDYDDEFWLANREQIMEKAVRAKFDQHDDLKQILISTGDAVLVEDSPNDMFWGMVNGEGENKMGKLLMKIRQEFEAAGHG